MSDIQLPKLETPPGTKPTQGEPRIFAMPESFRGLAARVNPPAIKPVTAPATIPVRPAVLPPPVKPGSILKKKGMAKTTKLIVISGAVLLVVLGSAGLYVYYSLLSVENNQPVVTNPPTNTAPVTIVTEKPPVVVETPPANTGTTVSPFPNNSQPGRDTDSDGLTDAEEIFYRTSSKKPDTDGDGFLDGNEVYHGYDPNSPAPSKLSDTALVTKYAVEKIYSLYYPTAWLAQTDVLKPNNAVFVVPSGETIVLNLEEKDVGVSLSAWFSGTNPNSNIKVTETKTKNNYQMLVTEDQMTVYIEAGSKVIIISYQNTVKATVDYLATFEMMINSLILLP